MMDGRDVSSLYRHIADTVASLLPKALEYDVPGVARLDVKSIPARLRAEMNAVDHTMINSAGRLVVYPRDAALATRRSALNLNRSASYPTRRCAIATLLDDGIRRWFVRIEGGLSSEDRDWA